MVTGFRVKSVLKPLLLMLGVGLLLSSCTGRAVVPRGWSGVTLSNDTLILGTMDSRLVAVNTSNGSLMWSEPLQNPPSAGVAIYAPPLIADDLIYVGGYIPVSGGGRGTVFAYNIGMKEPTWLYPKQGVLDGGIVGGLVFSEGRIYFGSSDGKVHSLMAKGLFEDWQFATADKIWSTPAVAGDTVYVTSFDKKLYALDANSGSKKWEFKTEGAIVSSPVIDGGSVYFGSLDRYFYALDAADGSLKWKFMGDNWFWSKPVIHNGVVYAANLDGKVYALDAKSGQKTVAFDLGSPSSASPALVGNRLIVATESGGVYSLDTGSNQQKLLVDLGEKVYSSPAAGVGKVYIHSNSDKLYEIDTLSGKKTELNIK